MHTYSSLIYSLKPTIQLLHFCFHISTWNLLMPCSAFLSSYISYPASSNKRMKGRKGLLSSYYADIIDVVSPTGWATAALTPISVATLRAVYSIVLPPVPGTCAIVPPTPMPQHPMPPSPVPPPSILTPIETITCAVGSWAPLPLSLLPP